MWFISDTARLTRERAAVAALMSEADWLQDADWRLTADARVKLDFTIAIGDQRYVLRMTYPKLFPSRRRKSRRWVRTIGCRPINTAMKRGISAFSIAPITGCPRSPAPT
jgi:hypothetical protein